MARIIKDFLIAALLALGSFLFGCSSLPPGQSVHIGVTLDPVGVEIGWANAPSLVPGTPAQWTMPEPTPPTITEATAPSE